jgi:hypothetical protein
MNTMHLLEQINKLWPDKLNDEQSKAVSDATAKLDLTPEQVTAVCRSIWGESASKIPLQVRIIDKLKDASNPMRHVRSGTANAPDDPFTWYRRALAGGNASNQNGDIDWAIEPVKAVAYYHASQCARDVKHYGSVRPNTIQDGWNDMRRFFGVEMADAWVRKYIAAEVAEEWVAYFADRGERSKAFSAKARRMVKP